MLTLLHFVFALSLRAVDYAPTFLIGACPLQGYEKKPAAAQAPDSRPSPIRSPSVQRQRRAAVVPAAAGTMSLSGQFNKLCSDDSDGKDFGA